LELGEQSYDETGSVFNRTEVVIRAMRGVGASARPLVGIALVVAFAMASLTGTNGVAVAAPGGSITGYVCTDNGSPIDGARVMAYDWDTDMFVGQSHSSENGSYTLGGLALARYRIKADAPRYSPEYYREGGSTPVAVVDPYCTDNVNFTLAPGGSISGFVRETDGTTPISGALVVAYAKVGGVWEFAADGYTEPDGSYSISSGKGEGVYCVKAEAAGFSGEYYTDASDPAEAIGIYLLGGSHVNGVSFALARTAFISGIVYEADGVTPIPGVHVMAFDNATGVLAGEGFSDALAACYYINLTPGTYRVKGEGAGCSATWYGEAESFRDATPVTVSGLSGESDVNLTLDTAMGVATLPADNATGTTARLNGNLTSLGTEADVTVSFVWGTTPGVHPQKTPRRVHDSTGRVSYVLSGLVPGTTYYYVAVAVGSGNPFYGAEISFTTVDAVPPVMYPVRCKITATGANLSWTTNELAKSQIDFGRTEDYDDSTGMALDFVTKHIVNLCDLSPNSTYHYRITVTDAFGNETVSRDCTFTTDSYYGGMESWQWRLVGFAVVAAVGAVFCFLWLKAR
jgi:hypothetical protein